MAEEYARYTYCRNGKMHDRGVAPRFAPASYCALGVGIALNHGCYESREQDSLLERCQHVPLLEIILSLQSEQNQKKKLQTRDRIIRKSALLSKVRPIQSD